MVKEADILLLGGGLASACNAETLRLEGFKGSIVMLSEESYLPYYRPQLPKAYLLGKRSEEQMLIFQAEYYRKQGIEVILNTRVTSVDPRKKQVTTQTNKKITYNKLLIATGCSPTKLEIPGDHLAGVFYLKTIPDAQLIRSKLKTASKVIVYGGSYIGIEVASLMKKMNMDVTIITDKFVLFNVSPSTEIADFIESHGVKVVLDESIVRFSGAKRVQAVETHSGKILPCDLVIIAEPHVPNTAFLEGSGIHLGDGVLVDQYFQTNKPDVFAAGDVADFYDPKYRRHHRNGGVDNAMKQGKISAMNMLGMRKSYNSASYFYSQAFDNAIVIIGDINDCNQRIVRGSIKERNGAIFYLCNDVLHGAFFSGRPVEEIKAAECLIINRVNLKPHKRKLANLNFLLQSIAKQNILSLQGGGALGAFECGVVKAMEEYQIYPDIVSGISIGAFNAAIIASNPKNAGKALEGFWRDLCVDIIYPANEQVRRLLASWHSILLGTPHFFFPRWFMPTETLEELPMHWTSFYDTTAMKALLHKYVDFEYLKDSPVRLLVMAVNVETSEFETFDSYSQEITADHILASGSLPPGFPWTTIGNKHYWDGGIVTNTPIDSTLDICGSTNKKIFIVELYSRNRELPKNMFEVLTRKDEILFSEKIRKEIHNQELICNFKKLVEGIVSFCEPAMVAEIKQNPTYIQLMGDPGVLSITRIIREIKRDEAYSWDSDFSRETITMHQNNGYKTAKKVLKNYTE